MEFSIERASGCLDEKPCEGAKRQTYKYAKEIRNISEDEFNLKYGKVYGLWRSKGTDHSVTKEGYITRRVKNNVEYWSIKFTTLKQLKDFIEKEGNIIIGFDRARDMHYITIYDDYVES